MILFRIKRVVIRGVKTYETPSSIYFLIILSSCGSQNSSKSSNSPTPSTGGSTQQNGGSSSQQTGTKQAQFSLTTYQSVANENVISDTSLEGTCVGVWTIQKTLSTIKLEPVVAGTPTLNNEMLEIMAIKKASGQDQYDIASCHGRGFERVTLANDKMTTATRTLTRVNGKEMTGSYQNQRSLDLKPRPGTPDAGKQLERSYTENKNSSAQYVKISDLTDHLSVLSQNWENDGQTVSKDTCCVSIETFSKDGLNRVRLGSDDDMEFQITQSDLDPADPLARVKEPNFVDTSKAKGVMDTGETLCKASFYFEEPLPIKKNLEFDFNFGIAEQIPDPEDANATIGERKLSGRTVIDLSTIR